MNLPPTIIFILNVTNSLSHGVNQLYRSKSWQFLLIIAIFILISGFTSISPAIALKAPNFSLENARTGIEVSLSSYTGKVILLDFFATWCEPCKQTIPVLQEVDANFVSSEFQLISIDVPGEEVSTVTTFIDDQEMNWIVLMDTEAKGVSQTYSVSSIPSFFLIDQTGEIQQTYLGSSITAEGLISEINSLISDNEQQAEPANQNQALGASLIFGSFLGVGIVGSGIFIAAVGGLLFWYNQSRPISSLNASIQTRKNDLEKKEGIMEEILEKTSRKEVTSLPTSGNLTVKRRKRRR